MAYSQDLRERVIGAIQRGDRSQREIAEDFEVSRSFVERVWRRFRETDSCSIKTWRHGPARRLAGSGEQSLRVVVAERPDLQLEELCEQVKAKNGNSVSISTMSRELKRLGIRRKKSNFMPANKTLHE
jgi:transposase